MGVVENRYKWRHNCVLRTLAEAIREKLAYVNTLPDDAKAVSSIAFVKAGSSMTNKQAERHRQLGLLASARDWSCDFDLPEYHHFPRPPYELPADVGATSNRIDAFIVSRKTQVLIAGPELTVPMEDNLEKQHTLKMERYQGMASCLHPGWRLAGTICVEMGCRGVDPPSFGQGLRLLGFGPKEIRDLRDNCAYIARFCSYLIWLNRYKADFSCPRIYWAGDRVMMDSSYVATDGVRVERTAFGHGVDRSADTA